MKFSLDSEDVSEKSEKSVDFEFCCHGNWNVHGMSVSTTFVIHVIILLPWKTDSSICYKLHQIIKRKQLEIECRKQGRLILIISKITAV